MGYNSPLTQPPRILRNLHRNHLPKRRKLPLQILRRSLKQQIPHINRVRRLNLHRRPAIRTRPIRLLHAEPGRASLLGGCHGGPHARLLGCIGRDGLLGRAGGAVETLEGCEHGGLLTDGKGGGGAWGGEEEGACWGGDGARGGSFDEMPIGGVVLAISVLSLSRFHYTFPRFQLLGRCQPVRETDGVGESNRTDSAAGKLT